MPTKTSLLCDAAADSVAVPSHTDLDGSTIASRTIEVWIKTGTDVTTSQVLYEEGGGTGGFNLYISGGNLFGNAWSSNTQNRGNCQIAVSTETIYHVAFVFDQPGAISRLYINGAEVDTGAASGTIPSHTGGLVRLGNNNGTTRNIAMGTIAAGSGFQANGHIAQLRVWNAVRTTTEINDNKYANLTGSETSLVIVYNLNDGSGTTVDDLTTRNLDGTITGAAWSSFEYTGGTVLAGAVMDARYGEKIRSGSISDLRAADRVLARSVGDLRAGDRVLSSSRADVSYAERQTSGARTDVRYAGRGLASNIADARWSDLAQVVLAGAVADLRYAERQRAYSSLDGRWSTDTLAGAFADVRQAERGLAGQSSDLLYTDHQIARAIADLSYRDLVRVSLLLDARYSEYVTARAVADVRHATRARIGTRADLHYSVLSLAVLAGAVAELRWSERQASGAVSDVRYPALKSVGAGADIRHRDLVAVEIIADILYRDLVVGGSATVDLLYRELVSAGVPAGLVWEARQRSGGRADLMWELLPISVPVPELVSSALVAESYVETLLRGPAGQHQLIESEISGELLESNSRERLEE